MDDLDRAQRIEEAAREAAIDAARHRYRESPMWADGVRICRDCYDEIPAARLAADPCAVRCIDCQRDQERRDGLHRP